MNRTCRSGLYQQKTFLEELIMAKETDFVVYSFILVVLFVVDAFETLISIFTKGIIKCKKALPEKKTEIELKKMLKKDLVELVIAYQA